MAGVAPAGEVGGLAAAQPRLDERHRLAAAGDLGGDVHAGGAAAEHDHIECSHISPSPSNFESRQERDRPGPGILHHRGEEVPYSDIAKGYELPTGDMVVLTDEDLADLPLVTAHRIEVLHFAPAAQVEPIYSNKAYYTEPEQAGARAYVLFRDALEASGKVAVAKVALRQREALAALRVREGVITLETLLWPDEVRTPDFAFLDEDIEVRSQELKMAASLIDTMTEDFEPGQYRDAYREALEAVVQAKVEGNDVVRPDGLDVPEAKKQPADLTEILRASVAAAKGGGRGKSDEDTEDTKSSAKPKSRRKASA